MTHVRRLALLLAATWGAVSGGVLALTPFPLIGTAWAWHATTHVDGRRSDVASPERYTVELLPDGEVRLRADCNRGRGRYESDDVALRFGPIATTKIGCPAGSRDREFLDLLSRVGRYRFEGIELVMASSDTSAGRAETMRFKPASPR